jgi:peptidoglycan/xylan/chitin deacetylase (PgdA/CDA1 family)
MTLITAVMYHYVRDLKNSNFPNLRALETSEFEEQINFFQNNYNFIDIEQLLQAFKNETILPPNSLLLTFDDGYLDHFINVLPVLEKNKIKGNFYCPIKPIKDRVILDVNKIHFILERVDNIENLINQIKELIGKYKSKYNLDSFNNYYKKFAKKGRYDNAKVNFVKKFLQSLSNTAVQDIILDELYTMYIEINQKDLCEKLYMNQSQIKQLYDLGHHIGCHGFKHINWTNLSKKDLSNEIDLSFEYYKSIGVNNSLKSACFPYGNYNVEVVSILKEKKIELAFSTDVNLINVNEDNPLVLSRLNTNDLPKKRDAKPNQWYVTNA